MKKISLAAIALYLNILGAFSQSAKTDSAHYSSKKLALNEINLVSSYYTQDGNNSAVTGGIGTEKLTDISNIIEVKLLRTDRRGRLHNINLEVGVDHYTSASSDKIDPSTISSPSYSDTRIYPSIGYSIKRPSSGITTGLTASLSTEFDYTSTGLAFNFSKTSKDNNREFGVKLQAYLDEWDVILPIELRTASDEGIHKPRNSYSASFNFSQVVNQRFQFSLLADIVSQTGLLATSYQRVYFSNNGENYEQLPDNRFKIPLGFKANYFLSDRFIIRSSYRYYTDDWSVTAHTADIELPIKITPFFSVSPFYRYYTQTAADYFAPYQQHNISQNFFTSDYDLSKFNSQFFGSGIRFTPEKGVFGINHWNMLEIRYGHYNRSNGLNSNIVSLNARFK
jgi:hypothetical protein